MKEEHRVAAEKGEESPCFNKIEDTHRSYDENLTIVIPNLCKNSRLVVATHNIDSINIARHLLEQYPNALN